MDFTGHKYTFLDEKRQVEVRKGIKRITMSYNDESMLCHFKLDKGAILELHQHAAVQNGFVLSGKVRLFTENDSAIFEAGRGYIFDSMEKHGVEVLEDSEFIECFTPMREEYR